eukprot:TRINITY_DN5559_c0_g2_i4.p1 TRINITY_DN5559_c0_g2~~TRINITY_DN5559_c0_g2_i4.p1  ORF type:complete len:177 (-),score=25.60 TRINITY_DN5559_c0_g2_i4:51-581(-)
MSTNPRSLFTLFLCFHTVATALGLAVGVYSASHVAGVHPLTVHLKPLLGVPPQGFIVLSDIVNGSETSDCHEMIESFKPDITYSCTIAANDIRIGGFAEEVQAGTEIEIKFSKVQYNTEQAAKTITAAVVSGDGTVIESAVNDKDWVPVSLVSFYVVSITPKSISCLLYTSDAADE